MSLTTLSGAEHARNQEYVHRVNAANGWFDKPVSFLDCMALLMTEVVEVHDAFLAEGLRGNRTARSHMASELADCYIRLVDDASRFMVDLGVQVDIHRHDFQPLGDVITFATVCMELVRRIRDAVEAYRNEGLGEDGAAGPETAGALARFFLELEATCDTFGVDLVKAFESKMEVNARRPYRHGNKHA